jgi:hypothetical protein
MHGSKIFVPAKPISARTKLRTSLAASLLLQRVCKRLRLCSDLPCNSLNHRKKEKKKKKERLLLSLLLF